MTRINDGTAFFEMVRDRRSAQVRARHFIAEIEQNFGDAAHANAADPDKMDVLETLKHGPPSPRGPRSSFPRPEWRRDARSFRFRPIAWDRPSTRESHRPAVCR